MNPNFPPQATPITLYRHPKSGHSHRAELMLALLDLPYRTVDVDLANGAHKTPEFRALNPLGQVPVIDDNGTIVSDSNAILVYLVRRYPDGRNWLPDTPHKAADVQRWLSVAAGEIAAGPCAARLVTVFAAPLDPAAAKANSHDLFGVIEPLLVTRDFLASAAPTLADVAAYSYIAHAPEGGVSLAPYPAIRAWLARIKALPGFIGMARSPCPDAA